MVTIFKGEEKEKLLAEAKALLQSAYMLETTFHRVEKISAIELPRGREGRLS